MQHRPHIVVLLAVSADSNIADVTRGPARFGSKADQAYLEKQIAAGTLGAHGTTLTVTNSKLL